MIISTNFTHWMKQIFYLGYKSFKVQFMVSCFVLLSLVLPSTALSLASRSGFCSVSSADYGVYACYKTTVISNDSIPDSICESGVEVSSCPTSNTIGLCTIQNSYVIENLTYNFTDKFYYYNVFGTDSFEEFNYLSEDCTTFGGTWSGTAPPFFDTVNVSGPLTNLTLTARVYLDSIDSYHPPVPHADSLISEYNINDDVQPLALAGPQSQKSSSKIYKVYVAALAGNGLPISSGYYFLNSNANWSYYTGGAIPEYLSNIDSTLTSYIDIAILEGVDVSTLIGTQIYVGYGTDDQEMLSAGRYRAIYTAQE